MFGLRTLSQAALRQAAHPVRRACAVPQAARALAGRAMGKKKHARQHVLGGGVVNTSSYVQARALVKLYSARLEIHLQYKVCK